MEWIFVFCQAHELYHIRMSKIWKNSDFPFDVPDINWRYQAYFSKSKSLNFKNSFTATSVPFPLAIYMLSYQILSFKYFSKGTATEYAYVLDVLPWNGHEYACSRTWLVKSLLRIAWL